MSKKLREAQEKAHLEAVRRLQAEGLPAEGAQQIVMMILRCSNHQLNRIGQALDKNKLKHVTESVKAETRRLRGALALQRLWRESVVHRRARRKVCDAVRAAGARDGDAAEVATRSAEVARTAWRECKERISAAPSSGCPRSRTARTPLGWAT